MRQMNHIDEDVTEDEADMTEGFSLETEEMEMDAESGSKRPVITDVWIKLRD